MNTISKQLDLLADFKIKRDLIEIEKEKLIDSILSPETKAHILDIEAEFEGKREAIDEAITRLEELIRSAVLEGCETVEGRYMQAVWCRARDKWDDKGLRNYASTNPELWQFYIKGDKPYVQIRNKKE